jgi:hypothetical protein
MALTLQEILTKYVNSSILTVSMPDTPASMPHIFAEVNKYLNLTTYRVDSMSGVPFDVFYVMQSLA